MALTLCVLLWAAAGQEEALAEYEDRVLDLLEAHGGRLLTRVQALEGGPTEVHVLELPSEQALSEFTADPARRALSTLRDRAIERTQVIRVRVV